ncbi:trypsin-like peptidase domain-containing protein [Enorma sp.]|uniref:S1C family serine protease n=1 Tax=Enorma sp. TaxID=1920692 RepID=UPI0025C0354B|nr:trypsin-like peptidase domain-containing protein [Enorma sp.]
MDDKNMQLPDNVPASENTGSSPRISIEPSQPEAQAQAGQAPQQPGAQAAYQQPGAYQVGATAQQPHAQPTPQHAASMPATATVDTRTVVKTKTKKLPVFLASLSGLVVGAVLVIALVMTGALNIGETNVEAPALSDSGTSGTQTIQIDAEDTTLAEAVAAKALPSVVSISAVNERSGEGGIGSGVILDTDGNVLTNHHVIEGATTIYVEVNEESYEAELVGADASSDLAVVKIKDIDKGQLTPIEVGDSNDITVGEWVMAIGSPFGNEQSVSTGIVSALYRSTALRGTSGTSIYANMIQTDAAINPGNSGGALVNAEGQLIGINSVIESYSGSSSGVGFAIPANYAINIANQIIAGETPAHPYIGVTVTSVNAFTAREQGLSVSEGAVVTSVNADSPAEEAGLQPDDIVTAVDGESIASADGLIIAAREHEIGETITLTVVRGDETFDVEVVLGSDAELQEENQDGTTGDSSGSLMDEDEFRQYLDDLMANR